MCENSEDIRQDQGNEGTVDSVCRDYIRGACDRKFCKYKHEVASLSFCHDFQNTTCPRPNCKFIHCTTEEVEEYKRSGQMSNQILAEAFRKYQLPGVQPVCNLFRKAICRKPYCKYRHISKEEEEAEIMELIQNNSRNTIGVSSFTESQINFALNNGLRRNGVHVEEDDFGPSLAKRRLLSSEPDFGENVITQIPNRIRPVFKGYFASNPPPPILGRMDARSLMLEEENSILHKEIAQLKRQISDLTATNEFLLDQNATLRMSSKRNASISVPAVTITNSLPQSNTNPQQVIRTVTASVATVPVSLATVTTCNPVSGNPVSITGCPEVSIASPAQILAPSQQILVTTNPPTQLTIANSSQAQLAIAQQNLANNLAAQQAQPQLTSQAQQLALATTTQQLTSQAQHMANQQLALASAPQQLTSQPQQITLTNNNQQLTLAGTPQNHLTTQAQQLANQQLTSQAQQLALANSALANTPQQLTSQAQQLALANTPQQLAVANVSQQLALASANPQLALAQQNLASNQQLEIHRSISTSQTIAMSNATQPLVSYPIMTQSINHAMQH